MEQYATQSAVCYLADGTPATAGGCSTNSLEAEAESAALDDYDDDNDVCRIIRRINENNIKADNPILLVTVWTVKAQK